jgi:hypothetical protein
VQLDFEGTHLCNKSETNSIDFDISQFNTYVRTLKFMMKSMFQTIMYRMFRIGRGDMGLYREALHMQAFNKESNNLFGYVIKRVLSAPQTSQLLKEPWTAIK